MKRDRQSGSWLPLIRTFRVVTWVILIALGGYLATAAYSAISLSPHGAGSAQFSVLDDGTVVIQATVNLSNPGYFPFTGLTIRSTLTLPNSSAPWLTSASQPINLMSGGTAQAVLRFSVSLPELSAQSFLLTRDVTLNETDYLNGTYATFVDFALVANETVNWGAPFHGFHAIVGAPQPESNGTLGVPVTISYTDDAQFALDGALEAALESSAGAVCARGTLPIVSQPHSSTVENQTFYLPPGCSPSGGQLLSTFVAPGYSVPLPAEPVP
ncbi:MAG TPA: hypothetical protein VGU43_07030 [Thermoplasmata archaeon]|nr:hypothetical protein [Thermoplasmata archaeon]